MARYIFVTGGVVSSLGKGLSSASLAFLLQSRGYKVRIRKLDPYLNVDPGTMSPFQHGEVFVTDDGAETDLDLGHYERFSGISAKKSDNITTGKIYNDVLKNERQGKYLGKTVQVIPHITNRIKEFIKFDIKREDFVICEIGGTVGDIESLPFLEAIRQFSNETGRENTLFIHLTLVPYMKASDEIKSKLNGVSGILIPGGFGKRGTEGKIAAISYARKNKIPFLGICFGMQMAVIEFARNKLKIKDATSSEFGSSKASVIGLMNEWTKGGKLIKGTDKNLGGTMRLGSYEAILMSNSLIHKIYKSTKINERHRHRYEVNINFKEVFEKKGMIFSGLSPDKKLPEIVELKGHPWFIGVQFHPEFKSRPLVPHPLFSSFIKATKNNSNKKR